MVILLSIEL